MMTPIARSSFRCLRLARQTPIRPITPLTTARLYSSEAGASPAGLATIKSDLKTAMRAKDTPRLTAIRAIMAANLNASKTDKAIETDLQLVALLRKLKKSAEDAAADAEAAGREDLVAKEEEQAKILEEYVGKCGVASVTAEEIMEVVGQKVQEVKEAGKEGKAAFGIVMGKVMGVLGGKDVNKEEVSKSVKKALGLE